MTYWLQMDEPILYKGQQGKSQETWALGPRVTQPGHKVTRKLYPC